MIEKLKKINPSVDNWIPAKKEKGYVSYSFPELVKVLGYEEAKRLAWGYSIHPVHHMCYLVKSFAEIHSIRDGYKIQVKMKNSLMKHGFVVIAGQDGEMEERDGYTNLKAYIAAMEEKGWKITQQVRHLCKELDKHLRE